MKNKKLHVRNGTLYLVQSIITSFTALGVLPILARYLKPEDFGALALSQIYAVLAVNLGNLALIDSLERNYFEFKKDNRKLSQLMYGTIFLSLIIFFVIVTVTMAYHSRIALAFGVVDKNNLLLTTYVSQYIMSLGGFYLMFYKSSENAKLYVMFMIPISVSSALLSIFIVTQTDMGVTSIPFSQAISWLFAVGIMIILFSKQYQFRLSLSVLLYSLRISIPLVPKVLAGILTTQIDKFLIGLFSTLSGVGIYSIGQRVSNVQNIVMVSMQNVFTPKLYEAMFNDEKNASLAAGKMLTPYAYISMLPAIIIVLYANELIHFLFPSEYKGASKIIIALTLFYSVLFFSKVASKQLMFKAKGYLISLLVFVVLGINLVLSIPFINWWGPIGAAWATFASGIATSLMSLYFAQSCFKINWERRKLAVIYGMLAVALFIALVLNDIPELILYSLKLIVIIMYVMFGIFIKVFTIENIRLVARIDSN